MKHIQGLVKPHSTILQYENGLSHGITLASLEKLIGMKQFDMKDANRTAKKKREQK